MGFWRETTRERREAISGSSYRRVLTTNGHVVGFQCGLS
ncbi:hypothetical protein RB6144 [Rhodopirellula baltica SH 1]|uniref:Uncharacterized protein n=1 Tax=Rhodopirellula baltica (strain DSM 10527 / NCIMB 13988 / SH1) TaxID=243090 RepID=Q7UQR6_RHOBA|nr:hypothetical protein RB6144 [Rhodopirellula baltica SH 1]